MSTNLGLNALGFIATNSLSYDEIQNDLIKFIDALSEEEKLGFKTMFTGTNGQILVDMIAAKSSDEIYHIIQSRSENLMYYLNRLDSAIAIAQNSSYVVGRGDNVKLQLTITPNETVQLSKLDIVGTAEDYNLIVMNDYSLIKGQQTTIECYIGNVNEQTLIATSEDLLVFRFTNQNISNQIVLFLEGKEVPITTNILNMINDAYFCMTNSYQSVDAIYLNKRTGFTHKYSNGQELTLKYIEYSDITLASIDIQFSFGTIDAVQQLHGTIAPEQINSIRTNAQLYAETQNRVVARDDFAKVFQISNPEIADAKGVDFDNAHVEVTYTKKDGNLLTNAEYDAAYANLYGRRTFGIPMCYLSHPDVMLNLDVTILLQLTTGNSTVIQSYVRQVLEKYELILGNTINFSDIEHDLEGYSFVKTARILLNYTTYEGGKLVPEGTSFIPSTPNGKIYIVRNPLFLTGESQPSWSTAIGSTTIDNDVIWTTEAKARTEVPVWTKQTSTRINDAVQSSSISSVQFRCTGFAYRSGQMEPSWADTIGSYTEDNQILWIAVEKDVTATQWSSNTIIPKGTIVNSTVSSNVSYQAINYIPTTSITEPNWLTDSSVFTDGAVQYAVIDQEYDYDNISNSNIELAWNQYIKFNETIKVV